MDNVVSMTAAPEPDFLAQCGEPHTKEQRTAWIRRTAAVARDRGCTWGRLSRHPEMPDLVLYEAWVKRPESEGEPRWQLGAAGA